MGWRSTSWHYKRCQTVSLALPWPPSFIASNRISMPAASSSTTTSQAASKSVSTQPQPGTTISFTKGVTMPPNANQEHQNASRLRGGGVAKDCCLGILGAFVCLECCEGICDCCAAVLCCPCEMLGI